MYRNKRHSLKKYYTNQWGYHKLHSYGITEKHFLQMLEWQENKCKICEKLLENGKEMHVDHNHATGDVRGVLCRNCNLGLGFFKDKISLLNKAVGYLERYSS